jgi:hypothetical protein
MRVADETLKTLAANMPCRADCPLDISRKLRARRYDLVDHNALTRLPEAVALSSSRQGPVSLFFAG